MRALIFAFCTFWCTHSAHGWNLTILHTNDVHSRFEPFNAKRRDCEPEEKKTPFCYGGASRRMTAVKKFRSENENVLFLDGGDQFQGTIWFTALKWQPIADYMNRMGYDAVAFGNHEFDNGIFGPNGLAAYLKNLTTRFINSNIRDKGSPLKDLFKSHVILDVGKGDVKERIGIIGYTTTETPQLSNTSKLLEFQNEITALTAAVADLKRANVNKIIAIGHAGIDVDKAICEQVHGVDVVVGGHTNTFLYKGKPPSEEVAEGEYPIPLKNNDGPCLVVQDYAFGKYLGKLDVSFDDKGQLLGWSGNPVLINNAFELDPDMEALLTPYVAQLIHFKTTVVGRTAVGIQGNREYCRLEECNLGNMLADAAVFAYVTKMGADLESGQVQRVNGTLQQAWTKGAIGLWNSGGIRDFEREAWSNLTLEDLYSIMPYGNTIEMMKLKGVYLKEVFEHSVSEYKVSNDPPGRFLQISGAQVVYDLLKPAGHRVVKLSTKCANCSVPTFKPVDPQEIYNIITITFLAKGGDGFTVLLDKGFDKDGSEMLDVDVVERYVRKYSPLVISKENRIRFVTASGGVSDDSPCSAGLSVKSRSGSILILAFVVLLKLLA